MAQFMAHYKWCAYKGQVTENGMAIEPNSYIALVFSGDKQRPAPVKR